MLEKILKQKAMIFTILIGVVLGGVVSYMKIGKLEDAEIPIKTAVVITVYPGASAHEVELEVTDVLENAIKKLENVKNLKSTSRPGLSMIEVNIKDNIRTEKLPQLWDHLRRKVGDAKGSLPAAAYAPIVNDDFADTYGILWAVTADNGYDLKELESYTEYIEKNISAIPGVRRSQIFGKQMQTIDVSFSLEKLAKMNVNPMFIAMAMQNETQIVNPGNIRVDKDAIRVGVGNKISTIEEIQDLLISTPQGTSFRLGDIAEVKHSFMKPKQEAFYFNGRRGFALGFSNESGVNVVEVGEQMNLRLEELKAELPAGIELGIVYDQGARVKVAVGDFMWNLAMSVGIVVVVLLFVMGLRSGLLISSGLVFTILATIIVMFAIDLPLHRVTLSSIILAMGMLVDNSIVVADGILVNLKKGMDKKTAFILPAQQTAMPLLAATLIAILAFLPLGMAPSIVGEFNASMFVVLVISLLLSWLFSMIQTPFMAEFMLKNQKQKKKKAKSGESNSFFRGILSFSLRNKTITLTTSFVVLIGSLYSFKYVTIDFFPGMEYDQFIVEYKLPQGSDINAVEEDLIEIDEYVRSIESVRNVSLSVGRPPARYNMMRLTSLGAANYGELVVEVDDMDRVDDIFSILNNYIASHYPDAKFRLQKYGAAFSDYEIEAQFSGPDPAVLRRLSEQAMDIMRANPLAESVTSNWENTTKIVEPIYAIDRAQRLGLTRNDMANSILIASTGMPIGAIYEGKTQVPIMLKTTTSLDNRLNEVKNIPVWGQRSANSTPIEQITKEIVLGYEDQVVHRFNGERMIRAQADAIPGHTADELQRMVQDEIEAIDLPKGYNLCWKGTKAMSEESNGSLFQFLPLAVAMMLIITIALFNGFRQPIIIFSLLPFALIGVVIGFLVTGVYLNFMGIIGVLGLLGMMIKNCIVLLDEIEINLRQGMSPLKATIESTVSRVRPVMMASLTTILGMIPLLSDSMFQSLAVAIMFGLLVGSIITLFVVPTFYVVLFRVDTSKSKFEKIEREENEDTIDAEEKKVHTVLD